MPSQPPSPKLKNCSNAPVFDAAPAPAPEGEPPELLVMGCALGAGIAKKVIHVGDTRAYVLKTSTKILVVPAETCERLPTGGEVVSEVLERMRFWFLDEKERQYQERCLMVTQEAYEKERLFW